MSYVRGAHYLWSDGERIHLWAAEGYDGWDQSIWAEGHGVDVDAVAERPAPSPSGVALPQTVAGAPMSSGLMEEIGPRMLARIAKRTGLRPDDL